MEGNTYGEIALDPLAAELLDTLGLHHQDRELSYPQRYNKMPQLKFEAALKLPTVPLLCHYLRIESREVLKPLHVRLP